MSETSIWRILVVIAAALVLIGNTAFWVNRSLADRDAFVETAREELEHADVREDIAEEIVFALMGNQPLLYQVAGPGAEVAVTQLLTAPNFQPLRDQIATALHTMITTGERPTIVIDTGFLQPIIAAIVAVIGPGAGLTVQGDQLEIVFFARQDIPSLEWFIDPLQSVGLLCGVAGLVILVLSVVASKQRPQALRRVAFALFAVVAITLVSLIPLRNLYVSEIDDSIAHAVTSGAINAFTNQLAIQTLVLLVAGVIILAVSFWWRGSLARTPEGQHPPGAPAS